MNTTCRISLGVRRQRALLGHEKEREEQQKDFIANYGHAWL